LPAVSVARHVTVVVPKVKVAPERGPHTGVSGPSTASLAVTLNVTVAPAPLAASIVRFDGIINTGGVVSSTLTLKLAVAVLPAASVERQVTVVSPNANSVPERGEHTGTMAPSTTSEALAEKVTVAPLFAVALVEKSSGTFSAGALVSDTLTTNELFAVLPALSVAVQRTVVLPNGKVEPDGALHVGAMAPSTASRAEAVKLSAAPEALVASALKSEGNVSTGKPVSFTTTLNVLLV
jgi:hypothetical protein